MIDFDENDVINKECEEFFGEEYAENSLTKDKTRFKRRKTNAKKAIRKRKIAKEIYISYHDSNWEWYNNLHQYSKNKIHCSCPICRLKRKDRDRYGKYCDLSASERRRVDEMDYETKEEIV